MLGLSTLSDCYRKVALALSSRRRTRANGEPLVARTSNTLLTATMRQQATLFLLFLRALVAHALTISNLSSFRIPICNLPSAEFSQVDLEECNLMIPTIRRRWPNTFPWTFAKYPGHLRDIHVPRTFRLNRCNMVVNLAPNYSRATMMIDQLAEGTQKLIDTCVELPKYPFGGEIWVGDLTNGYVIVTISKPKVKTARLGDESSALSSGLKVSNETLYKT